MTKPTTTDEQFVGPLPEDVVGDDYPQCPPHYPGGVVAWRRMGNRLMDADCHIYKPGEPGMELVTVRSVPCI